MPKPPPPGWENHPFTPGLIRRIQPKSAAAQFFPALKSNEEWKKQQEEADANERVRREKWR
jgi:hypothetical protein